MPNWVQNNIKFSGDTAEIKKMLETIKNDEISFGSIDFNKIIPMPESLNIECGSITNKGIEMVKNYLESMPEKLKGKEGTYEEFIADLRNHSTDISDEKEKKIWDVGVTAVSNLYQYEAPTWYEWRCKNWGTKWNACECTEVDENAKSISFQTAWSTPFPVMKRLSEMFPNIEIRTEFADEDIGQNCGMYTYKGGEIISKWNPADEETNKEALEFAARVWEYDLSDFQLHLNATGTDYIYTGESDYELIELFGKPALFTDERLTLNDVPLGLNIYHIRMSDNDSVFAALEPEVRVNHGGSVIASENIDFGEEGYIEFTDETRPYFLSQGLSIDDYVTDNYTMDVAQAEEQSGGMQLCQ